MIECILYYVSYRPFKNDRSLFFNYCFFWGQLFYFITKRSFYMVRKYRIDPFFLFLWNAAAPRARVNCLRSLLYVLSYLLGVDILGSWKSGPLVQGQQNPVISSARKSHFHVLHPCTPPKSGVEQGNIFQNRGHLYDIPTYLYSYHVQIFF